MGQSGFFIASAVYLSLKKEAKVRNFAMERTIRENGGDGTGSMVEDFFKTAIYYS
jgi:hypothetical protein